MPRGKYAERAKTKKAADAATAVEVAEVNRLRKRIRELENLEEDNERLRRRNAILEIGYREELDPKVAYLQGELEGTKDALRMNKERYSAFVGGLADAMIQGLQDVLDECGIRHNSKQWRRLVAVGGAPVFRFIEVPKDGRLHKAMTKALIVRQFEAGMKSIGA